jgi:TonB family protein
MGGRILATLALALIVAAPCAGTPFFLQDGSRLDVAEFKILDDFLELTLESGKEMQVPLDAVDYRATYLNELAGTGGPEAGSGVFLGRGKYLVFQSFLLEGDRIQFELDDGALMTLPLDAIDFRSTVLESRGLALGGLSATPSKTSGRKATPARRAGSKAQSRSSRASRSPVASPGSGGAGGPEREGMFNEPDNQENIMPPGEFPQGGPESVPDRPGRASPRHRITRAEPMSKVEPIYDHSVVPPGPGLNALVEVTVGADGTVRNVKVIKSTGIPSLDQSAVEAIQQWVYRPAERDGVPYESRRLERMTFRPIASGS